MSPICSKAIGPSSGLFSLWANKRGLEKRSSTCRAPVRPLVFLYLLPAHSFGFFPFPLCCRRKRGKRSFCGWPLPLDRFSAERSTLGLLSSGAVGVVVSHPLSMREGLGSCPCPCAPASVTVCISLVFHPFGFAVRLAKTGWYAAAGCRTSLMNPI